MMKNILTKLYYTDRSSALNIFRAYCIQNYNIETLFKCCIVSDEIAYNEIECSLLIEGELNDHV